MKILHIADIHWRGLSRHDEYKESFLAFFEQARSLKPDIIYIGGDIVHNKTQGISLELIDCLCWWFKSLSDIAPIHIILGNHDGLMLNSDRQDAISPIVKALDNPKIYLYKKSGIFPIPDHEKFNWCVFSCFDESSWKDVFPEDDKINIALFHGAVWGSLTDIEWEIDGDVDTSFFNDYDFALLGDIHKRQFLNEKRTIAYPGSTIQQNYGESCGKGFLFWDIRGKDDFDVEFFEIPHFKPFVTLDWQGSVEKTLFIANDHLDESRFRIRSDNTLSHADSKKIQFDLKREKSASEVVFKSESSFDASKIQIQDGSFKKENLRDSSTIKRLIRGYYKNANLNKEILSQFDKLIDSYISQISEEEESLRNTRWQINKIKFDNLFAYGSGNLINFENLPGITGIFGKNTKGKSSIIGSIMYGLFNTTDRGSIKNEHIINSRKNNCIAEIDISVNSEPFRILRSTVKHQTRKGEIYSATSLNLYKLDELGDIQEDLTEEQRRETEKVLRKIIGSADDFSMTSLAAQGEMNTFIREKATARKIILTKFLDLNIFEKMHDIAKSESSEIRNKMKTFPDLDWQSEIDELKIILSDSKNKKKLYTADILSKREMLQRLSADLATSDNPDIITIEELDRKKLSIDELSNVLIKVDKKEDSLKIQIAEKREKREKIEQVKKDFSIDDLRNKLEHQAELERGIIDLRHKSEKIEFELLRQKRSVKRLNGIPCGDTYPTCKFIKDSYSDKDKIDDQISLSSASRSTLSSAKSALKLILNEEIDAKIKKYEKLSGMQASLSMEVSKIQVSYNNTINEKKNISSELESLKDDLAEMKERYIEDEDNRSAMIRRRISEISEELTGLDRKKTKEIERITKTSVETLNLERDKKDFSKFKDGILMYDMFIQSVSKKGIPLQIMMSQLPIINLEISKILQGVTGFTVELEADLDSNSMDVFINYGDSKRIIELASGMEKMMASLAIRVALINVSTLTKTNMLIIDEGFGALDELNIEACTRLLSSLKKWFRNIIIISHVDSIKDAVDHSLEITKKEKNTIVYHP